MRTYIALAIAAATATATVTQDTCDAAYWASSKLGWTCTQSDTAATTCVNSKTDTAALQTDSAKSTMVTAFDLYCDDFTPVVAKYDKTKCDAYITAQKKLDAAWVEPTTDAKMDWAWAKNCYQGATGVTVFGATIIAAIAALAF